MHRKHLLCAGSALAVFTAKAMASMATAGSPSGRKFELSPYRAPNLAPTNFKNTQFLHAANTLVTGARQINHSKHLASGKVLCGIFARFVS